MPSFARLTAARLATLVIAVGGLAIATARPAQAAGNLTASLATFLDDEDGRSVDLDLYWDATDWLALAAGAGSTDSASSLADLSGRSLRAAFDVHGEALGARLAWRNWQDGSEFESDVLNGEIYWRHDGLKLGLIGEQRDIDIGYSITLANRVIERTLAFSGTGVGAEASWYGDVWGVYARGIVYDYDSALDRAIAASQQPNLTRFPRIQGLVASLLTRTAGAIDDDLSVGVERSFQRSGLRLDLARSRDAISQADSTSASVAYRYTLTPRFDIEGTVGVTDTEDRDSVGFAGVTLSLRN